GSVRSALAHWPTTRWRNTRLTHLAPQGLLPSARKLIQSGMLSDPELVRQIRLVRQRLPNRPQQGFFVEGLQQARDRVRIAHHLPGLPIVTAAYQDRRQVPARRHQTPA